MRFSFYRPVRWAAAVALAVAVVSPLAPLSQKAHALSTQTPWQKPKQSELTAVWWRWLLSIPVSKSPVIDPPPTAPAGTIGGANACSGQPYPDLLFLAGTFTVSNLQNGDVVGEVTRSISVKNGTALFFPLLNGEADNVGCKPHLASAPGQCPFPRPFSVPQLRAYIAAQQDVATGLYSKLTPTAANFKTATAPTRLLEHPRLRSPVFSFTLPATDNLYQSAGVNVSGKIEPAVADGYYSLIRGDLPGNLAPGYYVLEFGGGAPINDKGNTFTDAITYHITVTPGGSACAP